ncbi:13921_t:CDS:2 [Entrophospora sp. SA101]|nr:13921_t:CDS:2 [Entrophospora sp. SA101]
MLLTQIDKNLGMLNEAKNWNNLKEELRNLEKANNIYGNNKNYHNINDNNDQAIKTIDKNKRVSIINEDVKNYEYFKNQYFETKELIELARKEGDDGLLNDVVKDLEVDKNGCIIHISAKAGGTESHDWTIMLFKMYKNWAIKNGYQVKLLDYVDGDSSIGFKSASLQINGEYVYGWCKYESGVHRLVRNSPFDIQNKRHTTFALVKVSPDVEDDDLNLINISPTDLKVETFRASGPGGQHVNTTESAVRITHLPTKITAQCQGSRSQHSNKADAMKLLKSRLYNKVLEEKQIAKRQNINISNFTPWDLRTGYETTQVDNVLLDGGLDE